MRTRDDLFNQILVRNNLTTADGFVTDAMLKTWFTDAHAWASSFHKWPMTQGRVSTTFTGTEELSIEGYKANSIRMIQQQSDRARIFRQWFSSGEQVCSVHRGHQTDGHDVAKDCKVAGRLGGVLHIDDLNFVGADNPEELCDGNGKANKEQWNADDPGTISQRQLKIQIVAGNSQTVRCRACQRFPAEMKVNDIVATRSEMTCEVDDNVLRATHVFFRLADNKNVHFRGSEAGTRFLPPFNRRSQRTRSRGKPNLAIRPEALQCLSS